MPNIDPIDPKMNIRRLSLSYIIALALIALLSISTYILLLNIIQQGRIDAPLINMAGRQRMLSQKLVKELLLLNQAQAPSARKVLHGDIDRIMDTWTRVHKGLQSGDKHSWFSGHNSDAANYKYIQVNQHFDRVHAGLSGLLQAYDPAQALNASDSKKVAEIAAASESYLIAMDRIVNQYETEAKARVDRLRKTEAAVLAGVLLLLVIEACFIFRPMIRQVRTSFNNLLQANQKLRQAHTNVKILKGMLPICAACKKIRDDAGYWNKIEEYIHRHSEAKFSHGICPDCARELYPELSSDRVDEDGKS